ncbi:MAG: hypothetical protein JW841_11185 [Deltaproteobacteria bacterium]|nr:hypothetical protein [Deltaproteobacteria bacterium]
MNKTRVYFHVFLLLSILPVGMVFAQSKTAPGLEIECCFPGQVTIDKDSRIVIISKAFKSISEVQINPAVNIAVKKISELGISDYNRKQGKKKWEVILFADKQAKLGSRAIVLQTPEGVSQEKEINIIPYVPQINDIKILSTKKNKWVVDFVLKVKYPGKALGKKSKLNIQMICGNDAIFTIRDVKKAINKGKGKWDVQGMVDNPGLNAYCEKPAEISVSVVDNNEYKGDYFTKKFQFK